MTTSTRARTLAATLETRMRELSIDQRTLAVRAGVAPATIRQIHRGEATAPQATTLAKLSRALGWPADALVRVLSALPPEPVSVAEARPSGYEPPTIREVSILDRIAELEDEIAALRRLVTGSLATGGYDVNAGG